MIFRSKSLSLFYRELSTLLAGGMPIMQALGDLVNHVPYGEFRNTVWRIHAELAQGRDLAASFRQFPRLFPEWHSGVVEAGEKTGKLADALRTLADQLEKNYADSLKLATGLAYPVLMLVFAFFAAPFLRLTQCAMGECLAGLGRNVLMAALAGAGVYMLRNLAGPALALVIYVPVLGRMPRQFAVTRFIRALQSLTAAGVPVLTAWRVAAGASGNVIVQKNLLEALRPMESGGTIADALARTGIFPRYMAGMIASGEKSGSIVRMLDSAASFCEKENDAVIGIALKIIPIVVYLVAAAAVMGMVFSTYSGYYNSILTLQ